MFDPGPCVYMEKIAGGPEIADLLDLDRPLAETLGLIAERKGTDIRDVMVVMLDRERHQDAMREVREAGARVRLITDGDVAASLLAVSESTAVDLLWGIGGTPEGVISAAAIKCIGGQLLGRLWPRDDDERQAAIDAGYDLDRVLTCDDLVKGDDAFFSATGVTDGDVLQGVRYQGDRGRRPSRWSCARARAPCGGSRPATTAPRCARWASPTPDQIAAGRRRAATTGRAAGPPWTWPAAAWPASAERRG